MSTTDDTVAEAVRIVRDTPGFATSRLDLIASLEAMRMLEARIRTQEDTYMVRETKAKPVESALMSSYAMEPLRFMCCGWEPGLSSDTMHRLGFYRDANGYDYEISMTSGETLEHDWAKIPMFSVTGWLYLDVV